MSKGYSIIDQGNYVEASCNTNGRTKMFRLYFKNEEAILTSWDDENFAWVEIDRPDPEDALAELYGTHLELF